MALSTDIGKIFQEIYLAEEDRDLHRFLFRDSSDCRMKRVPFKVKSSPFLATSVLLHHASTHRHTHPLASQCIEESFYVDDLLSGANTVDEAMKIRDSTCNLLEEADMSLRKWRTNSDDFRATIPEHIEETADLSLPLAHNSPKALGIHWQVTSDALHVAISIVPPDKLVTKMSNCFYHGTGA